MLDKLKEFFKKKFKLEVCRNYGVHEPNGTFSYRYNDKFRIMYSYKRFIPIWDTIKVYEGLRQVNLTFDSLGEAEEFAREHFKTIDDVLEYNYNIENEYRKYKEEYFKSIEII